MKENAVAHLFIKLRKDKGYTQTDLANLLGISFQAVSKWERGENLPDAYTLIELAKIYNITVDEILKGELKEKEFPSKTIRRNRIILSLSILMIVLSPVSIFIYGVDNYTLYIPVILIITAISVGLIIYISLSSTSCYTSKLKNREQRKKEEIIYTICAGIFLTLGLVWDLFHIAWIIFVFGYALTLLVKND